MKLISKVRFDALASYARHPGAPLLGLELAWLASVDEGVLAVFVVDTDGEFSAQVLARDLKERYRWVTATAFSTKPMEALADLQLTVDQLLSSLEEERSQGDEVGKPVDFFTPVRPAGKLHPAFVALATTEGYAPARGIIEPMMRWYDDADGNFVEQFQTTGFDARIWELYLFAALSEVGYGFDRSFATPDFVAQGLRGEFCVEATTVHPTMDDGQAVPAPSPTTPEELVTYAREYLPIRYAGPLTTKLKKRYWEQPHVADKPLLFAIQDFHEPMSMTWSRTALPTYLYGYVHAAKRESDGSLTIIATKVATHSFREKEIPSGFFYQPDAEHVSAVLFNNSGTIAKFNRMGVIAGFGSEDLVLVRQGTAFNPDPNASEPEPFVHVVNKEYVEAWLEGMDVYHNPRARNPLDPEMLPGAVHHRLLEDGRVESVGDRWQPLTSVTAIMAMRGAVSARDSNAETSGA